MSKIIKYFLLANLIFIGCATMVQAYQVAAVKEGATIHGQVTFSGSAPAPLQFEVEKNPEVCGPQRSLVKVEAQNGMLKGAIVVLEGVESGKPFAKQEFRGLSPGKGTFQYVGGESLGLRVNTENCNFGPFTGVVTPDEAVRFGNKDSVKHVLHTFVSLDTRGYVLRTLHNRDIQPDGAFDRTFTSGKLKDSRLVRIACNRHDFMQNWLYVVKNPYFAISDEKGKFVIDNIPPGHYTLRAWHPVLGLQEQEVHVIPGKELGTDFAFSE
ncbi:MAG: hypothetical protein WD032_01325 [Nitrospirales bacterium]